VKERKKKAELEGKIKEISSGRKQLKREEWRKG
jgi:hypothetical protein